MGDFKFIVFMVIGLPFLSGIVRSSARTISFKMPPTTSTSPHVLVDDFFYYFAYGSNLLKERIQVSFYRSEKK